jgi:CRP-like cAMP-binding protein
MSTGASPLTSSPRPSQPPERTLTPPSGEFGGHGAVVTTLKRGATFGEMALLYTRRRTATVVAAWRSRVWSLARSAYLDVLVNVPIDGIDTISVLRRLPLFRTDGAGGAGQKRLFPASLDTRVYRVGCAMQSSSYSRGAVILELRPWSNVLLLVRSGSVRHGRTVVGEGAMVVTGRPLDVALLSVAAELTGQRVVHAAWGSEVPSIVAEEDCELLAISLQEFVLLLGASEELLADPRSIRQLLRDVPDLTMLSDEKLEQLVARAAVRSLEAGTQLYVEGELAERVHVLVDGQLLSEGSGLCHTMIGDIASAEMLGMRSVVHGEPCHASVVALTRCVTICFAGHEFREVTGLAASTLLGSAPIRKSAPHESSASITRVIGVVGQGAYGPVQLCEHANGETVCVKLMRRDAVTEDRQQTAVMTEVELLREVRHSFVVSLLGTVKTERHLGLVLEPLLGGDLFQHLITRPSGTVSSDAARFYSSCVISVLGHLHARRIVFRDLKPENLMLMTDGYVKLIDFGYAKRLVERTYSVVGTVEYLAPEVIMQRGHRFGADWWALGVLLFEMVAGYTPFTCGGTLANEMEICKNITSSAFRIDFPPDLPTCAAPPDTPSGPNSCLSCDRGASGYLRCHRDQAHVRQTISMRPCPHHNDNCRRTFFDPAASMCAGILAMPSSDC